MVHITVFHVPTAVRLTKPVGNWGEGYLVELVFIGPVGAEIIRDGEKRLADLGAFELAYQIVNGTSYDSRTPIAVISVLEDAKRRGARIRLWYGNTDTGKAWLEENDTTGTLGRSTGRDKIPLLIYNSRSTDGGGLLDHCIVRITRTTDGADLYRHPAYHSSKLTSGPNNDAKYKVTVYADGEVVVNFKDQAQADRYIKKMSV